MPGPVFWCVVYAGVFGASALRRYHQSRAPYRMGRAGWEENPKERDVVRIPRMLRRWFWTGLIWVFLNGLSAPFRLVDWIFTWDDDDE